MNLAGKMQLTWTNVGTQVANVHLHCMELQINHMHLPVPDTIRYMLKQNRTGQADRGVVGGS